MSWRESNRTKVLSALRQQLESVSLSRKGMAFTAMMRVANVSRLTVSCMGRQLVPSALDVPCEVGADGPWTMPTVADEWSGTLLQIESLNPDSENVPPLLANACDIPELQVCRASSSEAAAEELLLSARNDSLTATIESRVSECVDFSFVVRYSPRFSLLSPAVMLGTVNLGLNALRSLSADQVDWDPQVKELRLAFAEPKCERFEFDPANPDRALRRLFGSRTPQAFGIRPPRLQMTEQPQKPPGHEGASLKERLRWLLTPPIEELLSDPDLHLPAQPFPFQMFGIKWLYDREAALLADEMGLGKTMQAIVAARLLWRFRLIKQVLIVCPKSLIPNWQGELAKWWPQSDGRVSVVTNNRRWFLRLGTENVVVKIVNYEALAREREWLEEQTFTHDLVILDEAQRIKNSSTQQHRAAKALKATRRWALTGTPLETRIDDLISIFSFLKPGLLRTATESSVRETVGGQKHMLRRRAQQVLNELPEKIDHEVPIELEGEQRAAYEKMEREKRMELNSLGDTVTVQHVFQVISRLRQICNCDPASGKSAKLDRLCDDLEEIESSRQKALIFSQFVKEELGGIRKIRAVLEERKIESLPFYGELSSAQRQANVHRFQNDDDVRALIMNYQTGGVGINLQEANYVFLFDRWWNPAVEDQAVARAYRLGQTKKVFVTRFFCVGTIEERIMLKLKERRRLFASVIDEEELTAESIGLSEEEIFGLFDLKVRPRGTGKVDPTRIRIVLENMDPTQFEELVARTYERRGYLVTHLGGSHDGGIDVVAEKRSDSGKEKIVVQCKRQRAKVDVATVRELWGVVNNDPSITLGVLATTCEFTADAQHFAKGKRLHLINSGGIRDLATKTGVATFDEQP